MLTKFLAWIHQAQDRAQWQAHGNKTSGSVRVGYVLSSCVTMEFVN